MNIKSCSLFVFLSLVTGLASAGMLTIKAPPEGLKLLIGSGTLKYGDKDMELTGVSVTHETITPVVEVGDIISGHVTLTHSEGTEGRYGNEVACRLRGPYELQVEFIGYKKFVCKSGNNTVNFRQPRNEGASDVILIFTKAPSPKSKTD